VTGMKEYSILDIALAVVPVGAAPTVDSRRRR